MKQLEILLLATFLLYGILSVDGLKCESYKAKNCQNGSEGCGERSIIDCGEESSSNIYSCFVLWEKKSVENGSESVPETVQYKGCFLNNKQCFDKETCTETGHGVKNNKLLFCCCRKDHCNEDFDWKPEPTQTPAKANPVIAPRSSSSSILVFTLVPLSCALFVTGTVFVHRKVFKKPLSSSQQTTDEENVLLDKNESAYASMTLVEVKASGRYGHVWKASMAGNNNYVAVKVLPLREFNSWSLEKEIYSLPLMGESDWVLKFLGARKAVEGETIQLWLISEYLEKGSLYDYLKGNLLKWSDMLQIANTMCQGLAFLHDEIDSLNGYKPAVAHRDFKSKNVLLRHDLTACVADFGLAHVFYPNKPVGTCHGQVGTRRYMSPEVLEGAVSFTRDNFQRIDMYACGLVLWELASRCNAQQGPIGEYKLPFEEFVGQQPTLEEMQETVVNQRKRPSIRPDWLTHPGLAIVAEAMKDAWDHDAEARISASCIVERLLSLNNKFQL